MEASEKLLEDRLRDVGGRLSSSPPPVDDELLRLLDQMEGFLSKVEQSPSVSMSNSLRPAMKALVAKEFLRHSDRDVKVAVAACLSEITRITAPEAPYDDEVMKEVFQRIVEAFENLDDITSHSSAKRVTILETVAKVRSCVVMLDLECDDLILEMFQYFLKTIRPNHTANIFSSMETIMTLVLEESEDISQDLITCLLESVKTVDGVSPDAKKLGERVIKNCAEKLKPYLMKLPKESMSEYSHVVGSICLGDAAAAVQNENHASGEIMADDSKVSERTISDDIPQGSAKTEQEVVYPDEHTDAADKSSKPSTDNGMVSVGNGEPTVEESSPKEKPEISNPSDPPKKNVESDRELDSLDGKLDTVQEKSKKTRGRKASSVQSKDATDHSLDASQPEKEPASPGKDEQSSKEGTGMSKVPSPVRIGDPDSTGPKQDRPAKSSKRRKRIAVDENLASHSERKESVDNSGTEGEHLPLKSSDSKKQVDEASDSERRPLKLSTKKSQPEDTDQTPEAGVAEVKSPRYTVKRIFVSDSKKKVDENSDSDRRPLKLSTKKSQPEDTNQTPESGAIEVKSPRHTVKRSFVSDLKKKADETSDYDRRPLKLSTKKSQPEDTDQTPETGNIVVKSPRKSAKRSSVSDTKKKIDETSDSDRRPLKLSTKRSQPEDTDQAPESGDIELKSPRQTGKRSSVADTKKKVDETSDSDRKPLKLSTKKSQPEDTDQTPETGEVEVKSPRQTVKRGSLASKVSKKSGQKNKKLTVQQDDLKPKKDVAQAVVKETVSSPKSAKKKSQVEDNLEESPKTLSRRKQARGSQEVVETPKSKLDDSMVGSTIKVWWPQDKQFYEGVVESYDSSKKKHKVVYTDGDVELLVLRKERWELVKDDPAEDSPDASVEEPRGKRSKTNTGSVQKEKDADTPVKSGTKSDSVAKRKGRPPKSSSMNDDDSSKGTNKATSSSHQNSAKSEIKLNKHDKPKIDKHDIKTGNSLKDDSTKASRKSHDATNKPASKNEPTGAVSKVKKEDASKRQLSEDSPKLGRQSRVTTTKSGAESKANGTSEKGKSADHGTDSGARLQSDKDKSKTVEKDGSVGRKRKRKGQGRS